VHNPMVPVKSSDVEAMGYSEQDETLDVRYRSGQVWRYHRVGSLVGNACMDSSSPSQYFKRYVLRNYRASQLS
jgi:hypothetical protein